MTTTVKNRTHMVILFPTILETAYELDLIPLNLLRIPLRF